MIKNLNIEKILKDSSILYDEPLKKYSYTKTGGNAEAVIFIETCYDLINIIKIAKENNIKINILGNGSNVLISDKGLKGFTIITNKFNKISITDNIVCCEAGVLLKELTKILIDNNLSNFEFACGIPGSIGGAVFMNAGAYGGEMKDVVIKVETIDFNGNLKEYTTEEMNFNYRTSIIQQKNEIITKVYLKLKKLNKENIIKKVNELNKMREKKQPLEYPSCGSVFKRPEGHFAGQLIQEADCQGLKVGGAKVSLKHAGFIVNINNATCEDYKKLIKIVQEKVYKNSGVKLEREVKILGE